MRQLFFAIFAIFLSSSSNANGTTQHYTEMKYQYNLAGALCRETLTGYWVIPGADIGRPGKLLVVYEDLQRGTLHIQTNGGWVQFQGGLPPATIESGSLENTSIVIYDTPNWESYCRSYDEALAIPKLCDTVRSQGSNLGMFWMAHGALTPEKEEQINNLRSRFLAIKKAEQDNNLAQRSGEAKSEAGLANTRERFSNLNNETGKADLLNRLSVFESNLSQANLLDERSNWDEQHIRSAFIYNDGRENQKYNSVYSANCNYFGE